MAVEGQVAVVGLKDLKRALRQVDVALPKQLRTAFKPIAEHVVSEVRSKLPTRSGEAAASVRPRASQTGAGIAFPAGGVPWRGVKADYFPWLDFGGTTGPGHVANGHNGYGGSIVRPIVKGGRYVYPTIKEQGPFIVEAAGKAVDDVAREAGFEVRG